MRISVDGRRKVQREAPKVLQPQITMASQARGLQNFISDLRNSKSKVRKAKAASNHHGLPFVCFRPWIVRFSVAA